MKGANIKLKDAHLVRENISTHLANAILHFAADVLANTDALIISRQDHDS